MTASWIIGDVFDGLATLEDGSVDLVVTSPPFLALRSYLPADHADKGREIGSESTPAEFLDVMLRFSAECSRVLAPHGSMCVELGDTYAGARGYGTPKDAIYGERHEELWHNGKPDRRFKKADDGWPLSKSKTLIPELYRIALAYGTNPLTGTPSPAGQWRIRNVVTWARPNPPVGALGDKWRPATSDVVIACRSGKRFWDDLATRKPHQVDPASYRGNGYSKGFPEGIPGNEEMPGNPSGAPLLDYWVIPPGGYNGSHYAVFPEELVVPLVKAMCPERVCRECGEPSRRIVKQTEEYADYRAKINQGGFQKVTEWDKASGNRSQGLGGSEGTGSPIRGDKFLDAGWSDCGHDSWRPGLVCDPFAGSGTTLAVATGHGHDAIGIDLDARNYELALQRIGPLLLDEALTLPA